MPTIGSITFAGVDLTGKLGCLSVVVSVTGRPDARYEYDPWFGEWWRIDGVADEVNMIVRRALGNGEV